jgi:two-component system response regulator MprA
MKTLEIDPSATIRDVLVIDDDRLVRDALAEVLTSAGFRVTLAENGTAGLERFAHGHFDVIVTDVRMPGPNGWEVARKIRQASADVGIIVMSANLDHRTAPGDGDAAQVMTLAKPFSLEELIGVIDGLVALSGQA